MFPNKSRIAKAVWLCLAGVVATTGVQAESLTQGISLPASVDYDSNLTMVSSGQQSVIRERIAPQYNLTYATDNQQFALTLGALVERSDKKSVSADRNDPRLGLKWKLQTPTSELNLAANYDQSSARTTEFEENGLVVVDRTRTTQGFGGNWKSQIAPRFNYSLGADYKAIDYDQTSLGLYPYKTYAGNLSLGYEFNERTEVFVTLNGSQFQPDGSQPNSTTYGSMLGVRQKLSERLDWSLQGGWVAISGASDTSGWQGNGRVNYLGDRANYTLDIGRSVSASGVLGGFGVSDQIRGAYSYALNDKTRLGFDVAWIDRSSSGTAGASTAQTYNAWAAYDLGDFWSLMLRIQRRQIDRDVGGNAEANLVGLTLTYAHPNF